MTQFDLTVGVLCLILGGLTLYAYVTLWRTQCSANKRIVKLAQALSCEQHLTTQLREELTRRGVETIVTPDQDGYAVTFRSHFPTPRVALSVKAWRGGPIGRA